MANTVERIKEISQQYADEIIEYFETFAAARAELTELLKKMQADTKQIQWDIENNPSGFKTETLHEVAWGFANKSANLEGHISFARRNIDGMLGILVKRGEELSALGFQGDFIRIDDSASGVNYTLVASVRGNNVTAELRY